MIGRRVTIVVAAVLAAATLFALATPGGSAGLWLAPSFLLAALLYLVSHLLRCVRLALLATPILGMSARTAMLIHLYTAPVALALPFKLGELFRIQQLASVSKRLIATIVTILVERTLDAACLLALCVLVIAAGEPSSAKLVQFTVFLVFAGGAAAFILLAAPSGLRRAQRYIVLRHIERRARIVLSTIDRLREITELGSLCLSRNSATLLLISVLIWAIEVAAVSVLLPAGEGSVLRGAAEAVNRVGSEWRWLFGLEGAEPVLRRASLLSFGVLVLLWPLVAVLYERRLSLPSREFAPRVVASGR
jgi:Lysylphosphatidylglycerol synthase TM region